MCFCLHFTALPAVICPRAEGMRNAAGFFGSLDRCKQLNQELCFSCSCSATSGARSRFTAAKVDVSHTRDGDWRLVFPSYNKSWILPSVPRVVLSLDILLASTYSWITYTTVREFSEPAAEQGFAPGEEVQQKAARSEVVPWAQRRPWQRHCAGGAELHGPSRSKCLPKYQHPETVAPHPGIAFTSCVYRWGGTAGPTSALLTRLFKLLQLLERQSSQWAQQLLHGLTCFHHTAVFSYYWRLCLPSKSKKKKWWIN